MVAPAPEQKKSKRRRKVPRLDAFTDEELAAAAELVASEQINIRLLHEEEIDGVVDGEMYGNTLKAARSKMVFVPSQQGFVEETTLSKEELLEARSHELQRLHGFMAKLVRAFMDVFVFVCVWWWWW